MTPSHHKMVRALAYTLVTLLAACQQPSASRPDREGPGSIDAALHQAVRSGAVPGVAAIIVDGDSVLYRGSADRNWLTSRYSTDHLFRIMSLTKIVTSVAVLMLWERDLLDLDLPVQEYLPRFRDRRVLVQLGPDGASLRSPIRPVTIRHLLSHTSGMAYAFSNPVASELVKRGDAELEIPLLHDPGERWIYGPSTAVLGELVERVSGQDLATFFLEEIFEPLGMRSTGYVFQRDLDRPDAPLFQRVRGRFVPKPSGTPYSARRASGDGGLWSTPEDFARFLSMLVGMGETRGVRVLKASTVVEMVTNQLPVGETVRVQYPQDSAVSLPFPREPLADGFGLGLQIHGTARPGFRPIGSASWAGLMNTYVWIDPDRAVGVLYWTQLYPFHDRETMRSLDIFESSVYRWLATLN